MDSQHFILIWILFFWTSNSTQVFYYCVPCYNGDSLHSRSMHVHMHLNSHAHTCMYIHIHKQTCKNSHLHLHAHSLAHICMHSHSYLHSHASKPECTFTHESWAHMHSCTYWRIHTNMRRSRHKHKLVAICTHPLAYACMHSHSPLTQI